MRPSLVFAVVVVVACLLGPTANAQTVRVPQDTDLQSALNSVPAGGTIEISAGTFPAPGNAFRVAFPGRSFTVRGLGEVVLQGSGGDILRIDDNPGGSRVTFENLIFRGGRSTTEARSGAVTISSATATFRNCRFEDNEVDAPSTGGGALRIQNDASIRIEGGRMDRNVAISRGGAMEIVESNVTLSGVVVADNNTRAGASPIHVGGAIWVLDSTMRVERSTFLDNSSGFAGGAIFAFGGWQSDAPDGGPGDPMQLTVLDSLFRRNTLPAGENFGGAIHVEDDATLVVERSRFEDNEAPNGGAIDTYRVVSTILDSAFIGNSAAPGPGGRSGGAIFLASSDFVDSSTNFGAINRRTDRMRIEGSLFSENRAGRNAGCILLNGDLNRQSGLGGVPQDGGAAENRAVLDLVETVFDNCQVLDAEGSGGALFVQLGDLDVDDVIFHDNETGPAADGGAILSLEDSLLRIDGSWLIGNEAEDLGGGIAAVGADLEIDFSRFLENRAGAGDATPIANSSGAALFTLPASAEFPAVGEVRNSLFVDQDGLPIVDADIDATRRNEMVYNGIAFRETSYDGRVFLNPLDSFAGRLPEEIDDVVINRPGGPNTDKGSEPSASLAGVPLDGDAFLVAAGAGVRAPGGQNLPLAAIAFGWSGAGATLGGSALDEFGGFETFDAPGDRRLVVDGTEITTVTVPDLDSVALCESSATSLCLRDDRFEVQVTSRDFVGMERPGNVVPFGTSDSGLFSFFNPDNWEVLVKVLDGCPITGNFWVFAAATTNVEYTLTVTDRVAGVSTSYFNPLGVSSPAITDTFALPTCAFSATAETDRALPPRELSAPSWQQATKGGCTTSDTELCLRDGRFRVTARFRDFENPEADGRVVQGAPSDDSGLFFFFNETNFELLVKVLDGCGVNQRYWVFAAATTNVEYTLTVEDLQTGESTSYFNPLGVSSDAITDTDALAVCP
ncbi:MAG: right-handed parallel beta-helix repeat-containing protein [Acidobacteriota bacterium]